jgi:hypothetical protein
MKEYIGVDLGKGGGGEKDRWGKVTGRATLAMTQAAMRVGNESKAIELRGNC